MQEAEDRWQEIIVRFVEDSAALVVGKREIVTGLLGENIKELLLVVGLHLCPVADNRTAKEVRDGESP